MNNFSLYEQKLTNNEVNITYTPSESTVTYTYKIIRNKDTYNEVTIDTNKETNIILNETGNYKIIVVEKDINNQEREITSGIYQLDLEKPLISVKGDSLQMRQLEKNETLTYKDLQGYITVYDKHDGDIYDRIKCNIDDIDFTTVNKYNLICSVSDKAGNTIEKNIPFEVTKSNQKLLNTTMTSLLFILIIIILYLLRYRKALIKTKKIEKFSIEPLKDKEKSISERLIDLFKKSCNKIGNLLKKSEVAKLVAERYEKYLGLYSEFFNEGMDIVSFKVIMAIVFMIITIFARALKFETVTLPELLIPMLIGFYVPNMLFFIRYKLHRNELENDLLQAIIIMNNAFKSGRSIIQAIELVSNELKGPIGEEFKKMHMELSFGLSLDVVFKRFSERIKLEEVTYLTASLTILNKTGGNIVKVFSSIEKTLFNKKKLRLEMNSLTGASKMIVYILFLVPIMFVLLISLISPTYFEPFYTTTLGFILMFIILIIYIVYVICIKKIMKVRM